MLTAHDKNESPLIEETEPGEDADNEEDEIASQDHADGQDFVDENVAEEQADGEDHADNKDTASEHQADGNENVGQQSGDEENSSDALTEWATDASSSAEPNGYDKLFRDQDTYDTEGTVCLHSVYSLFLSIYFLVYILFYF